MENVDDLCLYYVVEYRDREGNLLKELLKKNGDNEIVRDINDYIYRRIEHMVSKQRLFVNEIKYGLNEVKNLILI
jgi:hypothetical protein